MTMAKTYKTTNTRKDKEFFYRISYNIFHQKNSIYSIFFSEMVKAAKKKGPHGDDIAKSMEVRCDLSLFIQPRYSLRNRFYQDPEKIHFLQISTGHRFFFDFIKTMHVEICNLLFYPLVTKVAMANCTVWCQCILGVLFSFFQCFVSLVSTVFGVTTLSNFFHTNILCLVRYPGIWGKLPGERPDFCAFAWISVFLPRFLWFSVHLGKPSFVKKRFFCEITS